jgi:hypothetical protein
MAVAAALVAGCSGSSSHPRTAASPSATVSPSSAAPAAGATVWLCRPGRRPDPCLADLSATAVLADGSSHPEVLPGTTKHDVDCFYVYPTVSLESTSNADLRIQQAQIDVAKAQAARFSSVCDVWAPMYRQRTVSGLFNLAEAAPDSLANRIAAASVQSAWRDYLAHHNDGRPVIFIGHSQGAAMLIRLLHSDIDPNAALRRQMLLALLLGGNPRVAKGRRTGGSFRHIPTCAHPGETGCVIAYSSFPSRPPFAAFFGRVGLGVSALSGERANRALQVMCVNPARVGGGVAPLHPYFPTQMVGSGVDTPWTTYPRRYTASCRSGRGASWLQVTPTHISGDDRPRLSETLGRMWGYHVVDVNIALGDLVADVAAAIRTWRTAHS